MLYQLSYGPSHIYRRIDSNSRRPGSKPGALSSELRRCSETSEVRTRNLPVDSRML